MNTPDEIKQALSALYDGEATPEEKKLAEKFMAQDPKYRAYFNELSGLSSSLQSWKAEDPSPDFVQKLKSIQKREGSIMTTLKKKINPKVGAGILVIGLICVIYAPLVEKFEQYQPGDADRQPVHELSIRGEEPSAPPTKSAVLKKESRQGVAGMQSSQVAPQSGAAQLSATPDFLRAVKQKRVSRDASTLQVSYDRAVEFEEAVIMPPPAAAELFNREGYARVRENAFLETVQNPLSTFSIDVDTASYGNLRRFLNSDQMPPKDAVRIEEMINYFNYDYPAPEGPEPFSITTEVGRAPWKQDHELVLVGLQGRQLDQESLPESNLVFLLDVSGSMNNPDKLPLLKKAFKRMLAQLGEKERIAIVTYAGSSGLVLESTPGSEKGEIMQALERLSAGGSTAGGAGIELAYKTAKENFIEGGNNRVILATDGDFNVGVSSDGALTRLIEEKREEGVFLTVLGFGTGNLQDHKMEQLANRGNGNYFYIDTFKEAQKVLVQELGSTLFTIAKDVKIQVEFNPAKVKAYRLIGYENRMLSKEDFNDDTKDAGELGAGHSVTALYEIVPADSAESFSNVDDLKYQKNAVVDSDELLTVKFRYKAPDSDASQLIEKVLHRPGGPEKSASENLKLAGTVAEFGMLLRDSKHKAASSYDNVLRTAKEVTGEDAWGYRAELIELIQKAKALDTSSGIQFKNK